MCCFRVWIWSRVPILHSNVKWYVPFKANTTEMARHFGGCMNSCTGVEIVGVFVLQMCVCVCILGCGISAEGRDLPDDPCVLCNL